MNTAVVREIAIELVRQARAGNSSALALAGSAAAVPLLVGMLLISWILSNSSATCGISGRVRFSGEPINQGEVVFTPSGGRAGQRRSALITAGAYQIPATRGLLRNQDYIVEIRALRPTGRRYRSQGQEIDELEQFLPSRLNSESELRARPVSVHNRIDFDLAP